MLYWFLIGWFIRGCKSSYILGVFYLILYLIYKILRVLSPYKKTCWRWWWDKACVGAIRIFNVNINYLHPVCLVLDAIQVLMNERIKGKNAVSASYNIQYEWSIVDITCVFCILGSHHVEKWKRPQFLPFTCCFRLYWTDVIEIFTAWMAFTEILKQ